ncbi:M3 family oligoendopeptidase [bacterium]|nr:M3 family oligoendopeptidase [bacterium]MBQ4437373.1 M3 family oligoendopeptidase [bacterium]
MDNRWNLDALYTGFDSPEFIGDCKKLDSKNEEYENFANTLSQSGDILEILKKYVALKSEISALTEKLLCFANLSFCADTNNAKANSYIELISIRQNRSSLADVKFIKWLTSSGFEPKTLRGTDLEECIFHFEELITKGRHILDDQTEQIISNLKLVGSSSWMNLHNVLIGSLTGKISTVDGRIEIKPISQIRAMAYSEDADVRKKAYEAEIRAYRKVEKAVAACINSIKGESIILARMRGYASPLEMVLTKNRMEKSIIDTMFSAIREYLPCFRAYYKKKAKMLGLSGSLPFYDIFAPVTAKAQSNFTYEEAAKFIVEKFSTFSRKLGDFAKNAFDNNWIDSEIRPGKVGGAFCENLFSISQSRILANFGSSYNDVTTIAHELGHAFHGHCLSNNVILNTGYPSPLAETASIFCETIINKAALKEADKESALAILESAISSAGQVIVDIYSRYLFETALFKAREVAPLSPEQLCEEMTKAQIESYGDGLDENVLHPYLWLIKPHYYNPDWNFYNFPYAFGLLFAKGLYAKYTETGSSFAEKYEFLLSETGKRSVTDVAKIVDVDLNDINFWKNSLELIKEDISKFLDL